MRKFDSGWLDTQRLLIPHIRPLRRGSGFEFGPVPLMNPGTPGFPNLTALATKSDFGFCYFGVRYGSMGRIECKIFFFLLLRLHEFL